MSARFTGRVVLVAGGTGGLGRAASAAFLDGITPLVGMLLRDSSGRAA